MEKLIEDFDELKKCAGKKCRFTYAGQEWSGYVAEKYDWPILIAKKEYVDDEGNKEMREGTIGQYPIGVVENDVPLEFQKLMPAENIYVEI